MTIEEIKLLRERYKLPSGSDLNSKINEGLTCVKYDEEKLTHKHAEDEMEIQTLTSKLTFLKEELNHESNILEAKSKELKKHKEELESIETEVKKVTVEQNQLQLKKESLRQIKPNLKDQRLIDQGLRKFKLFKEFTGIRWNFDALEISTKGFVTNKQDYIHPFEYDLKTSSHELNNLLWKEIEKTIEKSKVVKEATKETQANN